MFEMAFLQRKEFRCEPSRLHCRKSDFPDEISSPHHTESRAMMRYCRCGTCRVLHEPLGEAYYYGPERMSNRFTAENRPEDFEKYSQLTFAKVAS